MIEGTGGIIEMLDQVEHQNKAVASLGLKSRIENAVMDLSGAGRAKLPPCRVGLDPLGFAEFSQLAEKQSVAAPDVQDGAIATLGTASADQVEEELLAGPPPPMTLVELAVDLYVLSVHLPPRTTLLTM